MNENNIDALQTRYDELLQRACPTDGHYRFLTDRTDDGAPHVEIGDDGFHLVTTERGLELSRETFATADELLFRLVSLVTFFMGVDFEFKNRAEGRDARRLIFAKQLELLASIGEDFERRGRRQIEATLAKNPYLD